MHRKSGFTIALFAMTVVFSFLMSCGGGGGGEGKITPNPVANAGTDQNVLAGVQVTLDGSGSSNASSYAWSFTSWPGVSATALSPSPAVSSPTFTASLDGSYQLRLVVKNGTVDSSPDTVTIRAVNAAPIPDTGQVKCYDAVGAEIPCSATGQDASYNAVNQPSYTDNGNETITDNVTGLMWQKCSMGRSGVDCTTGTLSSYNWYRASGTADPTYNPLGTSVCGNLTLADYSDWRLPTDAELMTLIDYSGAFTYAINSLYFPNTDFGPYWSSTLFSDIRAWSLSSLGGFVTTLKTTSDPVRCVRGATSFPLLIDNGDGTVTDLAASLMWQKQADNTVRTWVDSISYCEGLLLGDHDDWRLPNAKELSSIVDTTKQSPAVDTTYFSGISNDVYWSSTTYIANPGQALTINFNYGATDVRAKESGVAYAWCVRGQ